MSMMQMLLGAGGAADVQIEDVFHQNAYEAPGSTLTVSDGVDNLNKGGLLWVKRRTGGGSAAHWLTSTEHTATSSTSDDYLSTNSNNTLQDGGANGTITWTSTGYQIPDGATELSSGGNNYVAWNFRKGKGFFDMVTWDGNGTSGRTISHNLGSVPGFIMVKSYDTGGSGSGWMCYHRSMGNTKAIRLDNNATVNTSSDWWNNTSPTATQFTLGNHEDVNGTWATYGRKYVAFIFGHTDGLIHCGGYDGTAGDLDVNCGFSNGAAWVMGKEINSSNGWMIFDSERGISTGDDSMLFANTEANQTSEDYIQPLDAGFTAMDDKNFNKDDNGSEEYIFVAIAKPTS